MNDLLLGIKQRESRAPIAIAWLADRTGIDHISRVLLQLQLPQFDSDQAVHG